MNTRNTYRRALFLSSAILLVFIVMSTILYKIYVHDYYDASTAAQQIVAEEHSAYSVSQLKNGTILLEPTHATVGLILYPGAKISAAAYTPLMDILAQNNILSIIIQMPDNMAFMDMNAGTKIIEQYPEIEHWYIAGHSLGGAMAASHVANHPNTYDGLILLAAYSTADLTQSGLRVLSIYGTNDAILQFDKYEKYYSMLPANTTELAIEGGCHSYFADYGIQKGEVAPPISRDEQTQITAAAIMDFILN